MAQNVGSFLERLDDQAERVAEEGDDVPHRETMEDASNNVASILAARGLSPSDAAVGASKDDDDDDDDGGDEDDEGQRSSRPDSAEENSSLVDAVRAPPIELNPPSKTLTQTENEDLSEHMEATEQLNHPKESSSSAVEEKKNEDASPELDKDATRKDSPPGTATEETSASPTTPNAAAENYSQSTQKEDGDTETHSNLPQSPTSAPATTGPGRDAVPATLTKDTSTMPVLSTANGLFSAAAPLIAKAQSASLLPSKGEHPTRTSASAAAATTSSNSTAAESQKELRTLRRSVVSLNQQLEAAEAELRAQREELERAGQQMEKDRHKQKELREKEKTRHANEIKALQQTHAQAIQAVQARADSHLEQVKAQLRQVEDQRMQEGGDWNKELKESVEREKEMAEKFRCADQEKTTLLHQISILQQQQESLGSRLESLSQTADNAMEREREAEQRLDEALTLHAKQIAQRQAREAELERTLAELGEALVQARQQTPATSVAGIEYNGGGSLESAEHEIDSLRNQLLYESQRASSLQAEMEAISRERTDEVTASHKQLRQHEREAAELREKLVQMENELIKYKGGSLEIGGRNGSSATRDDQESLRQIKQLSEEVLRQREKISNSSSEISALKSRLKLAAEKASKAELALESAQFENGYGTPDVENGAGMRRRRRGRSPKPATIRSALQLDSLSHSNSSDQIGQALDGLDSFLLQSGKILRYQPLARLLFIVYLIMIHVWTFFLLFVHAHGYETVHGDFGAGQGVPHGPHALMKSPEVEQSNGVAST